MYVTSAFAALVYASNIRYAESATNYLAESADSDPFLHTWSLAVEEQFYMFWPLLLFLVVRDCPPVQIRKRLATTLIVAGFLSLLLSIYLTFHNQPWAFFNPFTRVWEFALGALAYLGGLTDNRRRTSELLQWLGLFALTSAACSFDNYTRFPGFAAVIPTLGIFAILISSVKAAQSVVTRVLESPAMRLCGELSYAWYLWHWPVFVLARSIFGAESIASRVMLIGLSFALA
ncbi:MAG: acyltransferase [Gammaproteobacteria bacterium]|nr:acyltransferase [Gammaproteobacteria bacterium]